ncbi:M24 family metallopeptidase [Candidatus Altiarchaeota archaeon]
MIPVKELKDRLSRVQDKMRGGRVKALYLGKTEDNYYLTGADTGRVLLTQDDAVVWVRDIYLELYARLYERAGYPIHVRTYEKDCVSKYLKGLRLRNIHVDDVSLDQANAIKASFGKKVKSSGIMQDVRCVKSDYEVGLIKKSCNIAKAGMRKAEEVICQGVRELDALAEIEAQLRRKGSMKAPFGGGMLLASGKNSADIHAKASLKKIGKGLIVVDLGAVYENYHSDTTRTFAINPNRRERESLAWIRSVEEDTIDAIYEGMKCSEVYTLVDERFNGRSHKQQHLPGHGVGLDIHEDPGLRPGNNKRLGKNMVFTIEPGLYVPGKYGVRWEDTILLDGKARVLT